jgi:hypothetical protein
MFLLEWDSQVLVQKVRVLDRRKLEGEEDIGLVVRGQVWRGKREPPRWGPELEPTPWDTIGWR